MLKSNHLSIKTETLNLNNIIWTIYGQAGLQILDYKEGNYILNLMASAYIYSKTMKFVSAMSAGWREKKIKNQLLDCGSGRSNMKLTQEKCQGYL